MKCSVCEDKATCKCVMCEHYFCKKCSIAHKFMFPNVSLFKPISEAEKNDHRDNNPT